MLFRSQDLIVYVLHPDKRFEVANYKNAFIPSNLEVRDSVRHGFGAFYAELFDETLRRSGGRAVVTEYAWQTTSCDPCPTPPLSPADILTLGGDEVGEGGKADGGESSGYWNPAPWVLTRLHTRYSAATLSDDLIFRAAPAVYGGRADWSGGLGDQGFFFDILPNPNHGNFDLVIAGSAPAVFTIDLSDAAGRLVGTSQYLDFQGGTLRKKMDYESLPAGVYMLRLRTAGRFWGKTIIVKP